MKTKLEMAHDYLRDIVSNWEYDDSFNPVDEAWKLADAMQAEAEKRSMYGANWDKEKQGQQNQKTYDAKCSKCNSVSKFSRLDGSIHRNEINREFLCVSCPVCQSDVWVDL